MRNSFIISLLLLLAIIPCAAFAPLPERTTTKVSGDLVNVSVDFGDDPSEVPLNALTRALASYPQPHYLRVTWTVGSLMDFYKYTALYDRRKHSVTVYSTRSEADNNGHTAFAEHLRFTKVQEKDFQKIAAAHKNDRNDWNWFDDLPQYGCRKHNLAAH